MRSGAEAALVLVRGSAPFSFWEATFAQVRAGDLKAAKRRQIERATLTFMLEPLTFRTLWMARSDLGRFAAFGPPTRNLYA